MIDYTKYRMNQLNSACAEFIRQESAGSLLLMLATIIAMVLANSPMAETYEHALHLFVDLPLLPDMSLLHWVNDGLMAIFFLVVGMEIKREFLFGELKSLSATLLPIAAAVGGMLIPAALYSLFNMGGPTAQGWAIPMSTDIAFSLGVLAFAAKRVPRSVIVFLTALAIVDDLGGIVVIALFYSTQLHWTALGAGLAVLMLMALFSWRNVHHPLPYVLGGVLTWYAFYQAGIHPTVAGVLTGFLIPAGTENTQHSHPLHLWEHKLSPLVGLPYHADLCTRECRYFDDERKLCFPRFPDRSWHHRRTLSGKASRYFYDCFPDGEAGHCQKTGRGQVDALPGRKHSGGHRLHDVYLPRLALLLGSRRAHLCEGSDRDCVHPLGPCRFVRI